MLAWLPAGARLPVKVHGLQPWDKSETLSGSPHLMSQSLSAPACPPVTTKCRAGSPPGSMRCAASVGTHTAARNGVASARKCASRYRGADSVLPSGPASRRQMAALPSQHAACQERKKKIHYFKRVSNERQGNSRYRDAGAELHAWRALRRITAALPFQHAACRAIIQVE